MSLDRDSGRPAIDDRAYAQLEEVADGDRDFLIEVVEQFLEGADKLMDQLVTDAEAGQLESMTRAAHTLKSSSAAVGAMRLSDLCDQVQRRGLDQRLEGCPHLARTALRELARARDELMQRITKLRD